MIEEQNNNSVQDQSGNKSKPMLPAVAFSSGGTTNARCTNGHTWTYAGSPHYNLENYPCDCGAVLYHSELCKCCGHNVVNPIPHNGR